jgi:protocatechuate 3,4-dioxygenase beta subunit
MEGLPPNVPLTVEIRAEGWPDRDEPEPLVLRPGETREVELVLGASATITGVLVDQLDAAIGEREMWCTRAEANAVGMFQPRPQSFTAATTDAQGRFRFDAVSPGKWWIGPARGDRGRVKDDVAAIGQLVEVRDTDTALDIVVRAPRGLYISGKVLEPNGSPASSCNVVAYFVGGRAFVDGRTDGEGLFSVGPLIDGTWKLRAQIPARQVAAEIAEARAGARDVVITLRQGGSIAGTVVDAASGEPVECEISYGRVDGDENGMSSSRPNAGGFQFEGVEPGVYSITARTRDGRTGTRGGIAVAPGERVDGVRVEVRPGAKLELAYDGPSRYAHCRMLCNGEPVLLTSFERGTIESTIVPPGAIEIRWREHDAYEVVHTQRTSLAAGERKRVELRVAR